MKLAIVELFNPLLHGEDNLMNNKYLLSYEISPEEFMRGDHNDIINVMYNYYNNEKKIRLKTDPLKVCNNYINIINNNRYYKLQLVKPFNIGDVKSCVLKTHILSVLQRKWKNYYNISRKR